MCVNFINASILCLQVISLPECFNSPYGTKYFPEYAEPLIDGPTTNTLKAAAEKNKVYHNNCQDRKNGYNFMLCIRIKKHNFRRISS